VREINQHIVNEKFEKQTLEELNKGIEEERKYMENLKEEFKRNEQRKLES